MALVGTPVTFDGSGSNDPDNGPQPLTFSWTFVQVPLGSTRTNANISAANQPQASFVPDVAGSYVLRLSVSDGPSGDTDESMVEVRVQNVPPIANAGADQSVLLGTEVQLDGTGSVDPNNGPQPLTFNWHFVSKLVNSQLTDADLIGFDTATPRFEPDVTGSYVLRLEVFDGEVSDFDNVLIEVAAFQDVTTLVRITTANERSTLNRQTRQTTSTADLTITNVSTTTIKVPIHAVFVPTADGVTMPEASGKTTDNKPFYDVGTKAKIVELKPNQAVTLGVKFVYASTVRFTYATQVFGVVP